MSAMIASYFSFGGAVDLVVHVLRTIGRWVGMTTVSRP